MSTQPVLLLVEDDPADARLIQRALQKIQLEARIVHVSREAIGADRQQGRELGRQEEVAVPGRSGLDGENNGGEAAIGVRQDEMAPGRRLKAVPSDPGALVLR